MQKSDDKTKGHRKENGSSKRKLEVVTSINALGFIAELIGGILFGSVALMSDAIHMLFDASAYGTASLASHIAETREGSEFWTFGFHRVEVVTALLNGLLLIPMSIWIVWEAYTRFLSPTHIDIWTTLLIAFAGLALNILSVFYLRGEKMNLNEKAAFYHLLGDVGGSLAVIFGVLIVYLTGITAADPIAAVLIAILVLWSSGKVLIEGTSIILQKSPFPPSEIKKEIEKIEGVCSAHNIKCWRVCSDVGVCSLHVQVEVDTLEKAGEIRKKVEDKLRERFGLEQMTVQVESKKGQSCSV